MLVAPDGWQLLKMNLDPNVPSFPNQPLTMMGFGSTTDGISEPYNSASQLMEAPTNYIAYADCATARNPDTGFAYGETLDDGRINSGIMDDFFCTMQNNPRTATCVGDSGSPVIIEGRNQDEDLLVATVSG
jgi:hypothetical protein